GITVTTSELGPRIVAIELEVPQRALAGVERREFERRMRAVGGAFVAVVEGSRARVRFELPTERAEAEPASETPDPPPAVPVPVADRGSIDRVRILLVDDDELVRASVTRVLAKHDVTTLSDGDAAIAKILAEDYDLVLCDLMM